MNFSLIIPHYNLCFKSQLLIINFIISLDYMYRSSTFSC